MENSNRVNNNVEEIKARLNVVDVVGEYVRLTKAGANWKGLCPFHHEKSPSFTVNEEKQFFHCFGCNKSGDIFTFVQEMESLEFREALKLLAEKAGVQLEEYKGTNHDDKKRILAALELATKFYETQLWKGMGKDKIMKYLHDRGLKDEIIQKFRLGYAPNGWDNIMKFLASRGYTIEEVAKTGLLVEKAVISHQSSEKIADDRLPMTNRFYDRFRDRIMFPIADAMGNVVGYSARVVPGGDESQAKYINTPETVVYHKSKVLYGLNYAKQAIKEKNYVLLVEGNMDVIASSQAGIENAVAVSGTALTSDQVVILKRYTDNIAMLFDMDSAGQQAAQKSANLCFEKEMNVKIVTLGEVKDASDAVQKDPALLLDAVKKSVSAMDYFFKNILERYDKKTASGKNNIVKDILDHVAHFENKIEKSFWIKKIAHELDVEENVVADVLRTVELNLQHDFQQQPDETPEQAEYFQKRSDVIRDCLLGVIISNKKVWKEIFENEFDKDWVKKDPMIEFILRSGPENDFSFDALTEKIKDEKSREKLKRIYFETKYRFSAGEVAEYSQEELRDSAKSYIAQYLKELQKEKLRSIIREIEIAEQKGDKDTLAKLMREFTRLSQAIK